MRFLTYIIIPFLIIVFYGCDEKDGNPTVQSRGELMGSWLLYEKGYSPGVGYIVETVSPMPPQVLILEEERISSSVNELDRFKFYEVLTDTVTQTEFIVLYKNRPPFHNDESGPTYSFLVTGDTLKLYFRYCYEGCHLGFRRIN